MSEQELTLAYNLLKKNKITGLPVNITTIAMIDRNPYAYKIEYIANSTRHNAIVLKE